MFGENCCNFICSRGILKSCDIYSSTPASSIQQVLNYDFSLLEPNSIIYVCSSAIPHFAQVIAPGLNIPYILVSGDSDDCVPNDLFQTANDFYAFISSPNLIHWFSQNCVLVSHPKLSQIPIGLDYHTMADKDHEWGLKKTPLDQEKELLEVATGAKPLIERECKAYANFQFLLNTRFAYDRLDAIHSIPPELVFFEPNKTERIKTWTTQSKYAFVISPHGNGLDCHRTWEALALGCIPIVKTSPLNPLFEELPVLIVQTWSEVSQELLDENVKLFSSKEFNLEKLKNSYWIKKIQSYKNNTVPIKVVKEANSLGYEK